MNSTMSYLTPFRIKNSRNKDEELQLPTPIPEDKSSILIPDTNNDDGPLQNIIPEDNFVPSASVELIKDAAIANNRNLRSKSKIKLSPDELVGKRISLKWPDGKYYTGTVIRKCITKNHKSKGTHVVKYDDDNIEYYERLDVNQFDYLDSRF